MQTLTKRPIPQPAPVVTAESLKVRLSATATIAPVAIPVPQEADVRERSGRVGLRFSGLALKIARGISFVYNLLAGPPMTERDRAQYSATVAQVQQHQVMAHLWSSKPNRDI